MSGHARTVSVGAKCLHEFAMNPRIGWLSLWDFPGSDVNNLSNTAKHHPSHADLKTDWKYCTSKDFKKSFSDAAMMLLWECAIESTVNIDQWLLHDVNGNWDRSKQIHAKVPKCRCKLLLAANSLVGSLYFKSALCCGEMMRNLYCVSPRINVSLVFIT